MADPIPRSQLALAEALKLALATTPLAKVTVSGLSEAAGVHRQTFYSHFSDVYDLAAWVFAREAADHILAHASREEWADGLVDLLVYMRENREQTYAVVESLSHRKLERFFYDSLAPMTEAIVDEVIGDLAVAPEDREFIITHYTVTTVGHILHWLADDMVEHPFALVSNLECLLDGGVLASLQRFSGRSAQRSRAAE